MECIVLAGGLGTRLAGVLDDKPKCLADINGKPFLEYLFEYLEDSGVQHVILSLGHKYEQVIDWLKGKAFLFKVTWVIEKEPLGTGGGIKLALTKSKYDKVFVLNGDTFFKVNLASMYESMQEEKMLLALKMMHQFDRYGVVELDDNGVIVKFKEKQYMQSGLINGGVTLINKRAFDWEQLPQKFSFETEILEKSIGTIKGVAIDGYFKDIGIPEDYYQFIDDVTNNTI